MTDDQLALTTPDTCLTCGKPYTPPVGEPLRACPDCRPRVEAQLRRHQTTDPALPWETRPTPQPRGGS